MMAVIGKLPATVQEVAKECYQKSEEMPESFSDYVASARGYAFVDDMEKAKQMLTKAVKDFTYNYKEALDAFTVANNEMKDKEFAKEIAKEIHTKYDSFELEFEYEECEIPKETLD